MYFGWLVGGLDGFIMLVWDLVGLVRFGGMAGEVYWIGQAGWVDWWVGWIGQVGWVGWAVIWLAGWLISLADDLYNLLQEQQGTKKEVFQ